MTKKKNPWRRKDLKTPDQAREALFEAGWHPSMAGQPQSDPKIVKALHDLYKANVRAATARIARWRQHD